jgi:hypothetical protein
MVGTVGADLRSPTTRRDLLPALPKPAPRFGDANTAPDTLRSD